MNSVPPRLDHLVLGTPDLEDTVRWFESVSGCRPLPGGIHPAWHTRNAVVPMGPGMYLEIIGPDPSAAPARPRIFHLDTLEAPRLVTWAAKGSGLELLSARARAHGIELGRPSPGGRQSPDGSRLTWELTDPFQPRASGLIPFFIDWGASPHPSAAPSAGIALEDFHAEHPDPAALQAQLRALDLECSVDRGPLPRLFATLSGRRGSIILT
jgi:catechol 2,3-dioxygenase-like lactoylglutathione lyase family enzyme